MCQILVAPLKKSIADNFLMAILMEVFSTAYNVNTKKTPVAILFLFFYHYCILDGEALMVTVSKAKFQRSPIFHYACGSMCVVP